MAYAAPFCNAMCAASGGGSKVPRGLPTLRGALVAGPGDAIAGL